MMSRGASPNDPGTMVGGPALLPHPLPLLPGLPGSWLKEGVIAQIWHLS